MHRHALYLCRIISRVLGDNRTLLHSHRLIRLALQTKSAPQRGQTLVSCLSESMECRPDTAGLLFGACPV